MCNQIVSERVFNYIPYVKSFFDSIVLSPIYFFKRIVDVPYSLFDSLKPEDSIRFRSRIGLLRIETEELTEELIEELSFDLPEEFREKMGDPQKKLLRVLNVTKEIAKKLGITQKIKLLLATRGADSTCSYGNAKTSTTPLLLFIAPHMVVHDYDSIDFIVAHELSHCANNDCLSQMVCSHAILSVELLASYFFTPYIIPLIEAVASPCLHYLSRKCELAADRKAFSILKSTQGAFKTFEDNQMANKKWREAEIQSFSHDKAKYFSLGGCFHRIVKRCVYWFAPHIIASPITPDGDDRFDLGHPTIEERKNALQFEQEKSS